LRLLSGFGSFVCGSLAVLLCAAALADPAKKEPPAQPEANVTPREASDECVLSEECIDQYLWSVYERARKVDTIKVQEQIETTVKKKGKSRTVKKTITKFVVEDFTWKDPDAAKKAGMSVAQYVIGGMDRAFKGRLYHLFRALDEAGLAPGMTSGFRDDYRQSITSGTKASTSSSYHGGSLRGGYGHGLAADIVSVKGETRTERCISSQVLWKWIDAHGKEYGIGRPYLDKDPPHVAPIDGKEYADKRGVNAKLAKKRTLPRAESQKRLNRFRPFGDVANLSRFKCLRCFSLFPLPPV
jgi:D-alanyl-D-alanine carboxypeptidase